MLSIFSFFYFVFKLDRKFDKILSDCLKSGIVQLSYDTIISEFAFVQSLNQMNEFKYVKYKGRKYYDLKELELHMLKENRDAKIINLIELRKYF